MGYDYHNWKHLMAQTYREPTEGLQRSTVFKPSDGDATVAPLLCAWELPVEMVPYVCQIQTQPFSEHVRQQKRWGSWEVWG